MTIKMFFAAAQHARVAEHRRRLRADRGDGEAAAAAKKVQAPRTAKSLACSKEADGKGLHGKPRKKFMSSCKKAITRHQTVLASC